jgi:RHS repeat-associated protein
VERFVYEPYGTDVVLNASWASTTDSYAWSCRFTGQEYTVDTQFYLYRTRYFHVQLGNFLIRDLIGYFGGLNLNNYVANCPTIWVDPLGLRQITISGTNGSPITVTIPDDLPPPTTPPASVQPSCCEDGLPPVADDAGRICCPEWMQTIRLYNDRSFPIPHTFLQTPSRTVGFYPAWKDSPIAPGIVRDNTGHPYSNFIEYHACWATVEQLEDSINRNPVGLFEPYLLLNPIVGDNCTSWACGRLGDAGLKPPLSRFLPLSNPWWAGPR